MLCGRMARNFKDLDNQLLVLVLHIQHALSQIKQWQLLLFCSCFELPEAFKKKLNTWCTEDFCHRTSCFLLWCSWGAEQFPPYWHMWSSFGSCKYVITLRWEFFPSPLKAERFAKLKPILDFHVTSWNIYVSHELRIL